ncbi:hypothetical protein TrST_g835 [Triparma strigata]|uniref:Uncharacterized protein n=1 Tax=Triparma strigata TaxID=1606541 RepID=A0A9W7BVD9_9STRA|nr:hypothetical protein TrST_g835 [Triparma strigata]
MSNMTSEFGDNAIATQDPSNLDGGDDDTEVFEGSELDSAADETPAAGGDDFMHTDDFRRLFVDFVMVDTLVAMRWLDKKWHKVVEKKLIEFEDEPHGEVIVHGGNDLSRSEAMSDTRRSDRIEQVTKVIFLLNITKVGDRACLFASILVVVDIPEGITSIGLDSFYFCSSLKTVKFPKSLTSMSVNSFGHCSSLEEVDLLHTNVQKLGAHAFAYCTSLREMKVPDSLQTCGEDVFMNCSKLVPSAINVGGEPAFNDEGSYDSNASWTEEEEDVTSEVVAYLRSIQ